MVAVNELALTKLLVYGTTTPDPDPNTHIRPNSTSSAPPPLNISMINYLTTGAGRYAKPSEVPLIAAFFNDSASSTPKLSDGTYNVATLATALGLTASPRLLRFAISQYTTDAISSDYIERAYVFGSTGFEITDTVTFTVNSGTYTVNNFELLAQRDNFDFQSSSTVATTANFFLNKAFDPYGLIPIVGTTTVPVDIIYTGSGRNYSTYTQTNFNTDSALVDGWTNLALNFPIATAKFGAALGGLETNLGYLGTINSDLHFSYYTPTGKKIIYGTPDNDRITSLSAEITPDIYFDFQMVGGDGNDRITGDIFDDELWGGPGSDTLDGGLGDDTFIGGNGDDEIDGGSFLFGLFEGTDTSVYNGAFADYELEFLPDDSIRIVDTVNNRDGSDTLNGVDFAQFSDKTINLAPGQDIAFVIDTTGSMLDDISAVKARSSEIINIIFDGDRGFIDSRIAVVGYNDPGTNTFLSFTDQPKIEDRKTAAINAINSISVGGGGDFPEVVNAGLIRALSGDAGEWRKEAAVRRIILFGDAPPKDTELRAEVLRLAEDVGGEDVPTAPNLPTFSIASDIETTNLATGLTVTRFEAETTDADGATVKFPVEIFTVLIGSDSTTREDFASLADATGGQSFNAANALELVDKLIEAINEPVDTSPNTPPELIDDNITTTVNTAVNIDVLANDSDAEGDTLSITSVTNPTNGSTEIVDNQVRFTPDALFLGENSFNYTVSDSEGSEATATVTVSVVLPEDATLGTQNQDNLSGTNVADVISGEAGNDNINGNGGADILFGKEGDDNINGTSSSEQISGGEGNDRISGNGGDDIILGGFGDDDILLGNGSPTVNSGSGNDEIWVNNANAIFILETGDGFDILYGLQTQQIENQLISFGVSDVDSIEFERVGNGIDILSAGDKLAQLDNFNQQQQIDLLESNKSEIFFEIA